VPKIDGRKARRQATEAKLVASVGAVLRDRGFQDLAIGTVAREAGVDKALVYRYFGGFDGLLEAWGRSAEFWPTLDEVLGAQREVLALDDPAEVAREILSRYAHGLLARPVTLELLAWECVERGPFAPALEATRERWSTALFGEAAAAGYPLAGSLPTLLSVFSAAINYLAVRSRHIRVFGGIEIGSDEGWEAIEQAIEDAIRALTR